jgi:PAS domain S-box-containing protein
MRETTVGGSADQPVREASAQLERQLAAAQQITHIGSFEWDLTTNAVTWSDELYRIYGLVPQSCEITLEVFVSKLHPDDRARVQNEIRLALERGGRFSYVERILRPDGSVRHLQTVGEVARDAQGRALGLIGTCRDVTDELEREQKIKIYADIVQNIQIGLTVWNVAVPGDAPSARLVAFNPAAEHAAEKSLAGSIGKSMGEILPALAGAELLQMVSTVAREGSVHEVHEVPTSYFVTAQHRARSYSVRAFPLPGCCVGLTLEDVTLQARARRLQAAEHRVLEMIASGSPLEEALESLIVLIENQAPSTLGSILLLDSGGTRLLHGAAPHLPEEYNRAVNGSAIGPKAGSCGTSAYLRQPVFVSDIETSPLWDDYRELARPYGFRACWSMPIFASDGRVLGTFALYYREPRAPGRDELELIARATHVAGIAIQRRQLDDQLHELWAHIEAVREDERTGMAREIHDELGQALTALKMDLAWIIRRANAEGSLGRDLLAEKLGAISKMTDGIIDTVRRISADLRPGVLDDLGLVAAIEWQAQEFERRSGITCVVRTTAHDTKFDRAASTALFRIFQEALTNVVRHAEAKHVDIAFDCTDGKVRLSVQDDGKGIEAEAIKSPSSLGLLGIRERIRRLDGSLTVSGEPGKGTLLVVEVPLAVAGVVR